MRVTTKARWAVWWTQRWSKPLSRQATTLIEVTPAQQAKLDDGLSHPDESSDREKTSRFARNDGNRFEHRHSQENLRETEVRLTWRPRIWAWLPRIRFVSFGFA